MLLFADGFDAYASAQLVDKWGSQFRGTIAYPGRLGYGGYFAATGGGLQVWHGLAGGPYTTLIVGFAFQQNGTGNDNGSMFQLQDNVGNILGQIVTTASGQLGWEVGTSGTYYYSSPGLMTAQAWGYIECDVTLSNSGAGAVTIRFNGTTVVTEASVNTSPSGVGCSIIALVNEWGNGNSESFVDDLYCLNTTAPNNTFLGDIKIIPLLPAGNGRIDGFSRFGGTSAGNWTAVNEVPPDYDTSYVYTSTAGTEDCYTLTTLSNVTTIVAVQLNGFARKDDTPSRVLSLGVGNGTTENFDAGTALNTTYTYILRQLDINPLTSAAWAVTDFTTLQAAVKLIS